MSGRQRATMSRDGRFDAFDLSARGAVLEGVVDAGSLPRMADSVADEGGTSRVGWTITGTADAMGRPALEIGLNGVVPLECQRCLREYDGPVAQVTLLLLARDERELARLDAEDEHEVVLAAAPLDALELVEDELLLTLPFAPRCGRPECVGAAGGADAADEGSSAFGALATLRPTLKSGN